MGYVGWKSTANYLYPEWLKVNNEMFKDIESLGKLSAIGYILKPYFIFYFFLNRYKVLTNYAKL